MSVTDVLQPEMERVRLVFGSFLFSILYGLRAKIPKNHIVCALLVWNYLKKIATHTGKTIYQLKHQLLSEYLVSELQDPTIKMTVI